MRLNTKEELFSLEIEQPSDTLYRQVQRRWDCVAKPLNGLGRFEEIFAQIGAISGSEEIDIANKAVIAMCADNGIVEEGVSQSGQEVTSVVTRFMGQNQTSVGKMATVVHADVIPVDIGINGTEEFLGVRNCKVAMGTKNFLKEPAMTEEETLKAISIGMELVKECREKGYRLLGTGEMGIGNTTTSSAVAAALTGCEAAEITGRGAGLDDAGLERKIAVIRQAMEKYSFFQSIQRKGEPTYERFCESFRVLQSVGGLDIAGLVGVYLGGAVYHVPIVMDGVISTVAALAAERLVPGTKAYMIPSHKSKEPAVQELCRELEIDPVIDGQLALGEGTGAVMMFALLDIARSLYGEQTTFGDMEIAPYQRYEEV